MTKLNKHFFEFSQKGSTAIVLIVASVQIGLFSLLADLVVRRSE